MRRDRVGDHMSTDIVTLFDSARLREGVELILVRRVRHVPVIGEAGELVGIVTDRDVMRAMPSPLSPPTPEEYEALLDGTPIERIMTREPLTVEADTPVKEAVHLMLDKKISGLPVLQDGTIIGLFTQTDALRGYLRFLEGSAPAARS